MAVYARVPDSPDHAPVLFELDVLACLGVLEAFGQAEVDHVEGGLALARTHEEVLGFDIAMDEAFLVENFDSLNELVCEH